MYCLCLVKIDSAKHKRKHCRKGCFNLHQKSVSWRVWFLQWWHQEPHKPMETSLFDKQQIQSLVHMCHAPLCAQVFRFKTCFLWCKIQLYLFSHWWFPPSSWFFPSPHSKQSTFLIRLGKHKTSIWLQLRTGILYLIKCPAAEAQDRRQIICFRNLFPSLERDSSFSVVHS